MTKVFLTIVAGVHPKRYELNAGLITIGSGAGNSINLPVSSTAQTYCSIKRLDRSKYLVEDSHKQGNICVNGIKTLSQHLVSGDLMQIGSVVMKYEITEDEPISKIVAGTKSSPVGQPLPSSVPTQATERRTATIPRRTTSMATDSPTIEKRTAAIPRRATAIATGSPKKSMDKKQIITFAIAAGVIAVILIVIFVIKGTSGPSQEELTQELTKILQKADGLSKKNEIIEADDLLAKTIENPRYANADALADIKNYLKSIQDRAGSERKALTEVTQFKEKFDKVNVAEIPLKETEQLLDECKSLIGKYSYSNQGPELQQMKAELEKSVADKTVNTGTDELAKIQKEVARLLGAGENNYSAAISFLDNSKAKHAENMFLGMGIKKELNSVNIKAKSEFNQKIKDKVAQLKKDNKSVDANNILKEALPRFKGADCYKDIEQLQ